MLLLETVALLLLLSCPGLGKPTGESLFLAGLGCEVEFPFIAFSLMLPSVLLAGSWV